MVFDFTKATDTNYFWAKVTKSYIGPASAEYQAKAGKRIVHQWHMDTQRLDIKYEDGGIPDVRTWSVNLPEEGAGVKKSSGLMKRVEAFNSVGLNIQTTEDIGQIEGHIYYFADEERSLGRNSSAKNAWPLTWDDGYDASTPRIVPRPTQNNGSVPSGDAWKEVAELLDGQSETVKIIPLIMSSGNQIINNNNDVVALANSGTLIKALEDKGLVTVEKGKISKVEVS